MKKTPLRAQLLRLSQHQIGLREAALLFNINGATTETLAKLTGDDKETVRGRIGTLRAKKLVTGKFNEAGHVVYSLTTTGQEIINSTLSEQ